MRHGARKRTGEHKNSCVDKRGTRRAASELELELERTWTHVKAHTKGRGAGGEEEERNGGVGEANLLLPGA